GMIRQEIILHFVIIPHHIPTGFQKTSLGGSIIAVGAILRPKFAEPVGAAAPVGVNGVAEVQEEIGALSAHCIHNREGLVTFPAIAAETKADSRRILAWRRSDEARDGAGFSPFNDRAIIVRRFRLQPVERDERGRIGVVSYFGGFRLGKLLESLILTVLNRHG